MTKGAYLAIWSHNMTTSTKGRETRAELHCQAAHKESLDNDKITSLNKQRYLVNTLCEGHMENHRNTF